MFRTSDFIFRNSTMADALIRAKIGNYRFPNEEGEPVPATQSLVREPRIEITGNRSGQIKPRLEHDYVPPVKDSSAAYKQGFRAWQRQSYS